MNTQHISSIKTPAQPERLTVGDLKPGDIFQWDTVNARYMVLSKEVIAYKGNGPGDKADNSLIPTLMLNDGTGFSRGWIAWHYADHRVARVYEKAVLEIS